MEYFHNRNKANIVVTTAIVILSVAILTAIEYNFTNVRAQTDMTNDTLFVSGSASNQTKPDKVTVSLGVETTNSYLHKRPLTANSNLMNKVLEALKAESVRENETVTPLLA